MEFNTYLYNQLVDCLYVLCVDNVDVKE